jgi:hypothetical protein
MLDGDLGFSKSGPVPVALPINAAFFEATESAIRLLILRALLHVSREKGRNRLQDAF